MRRRGLHVPVERGPGERGMTTGSTKPASTRTQKAGFAIQPGTIDPRVYARRWKTLAVLALSLVIIGLDNTILNVALPTLQKEFNASSSTLQWMVDSYLLVFAGLLLTMGTLGDRFGRKWALQAGLVIFGGASLAVLAVNTADQLIMV